MAGFVESNALSFICRRYHRAFFQTADDTVDSVHEVLFLNELLIATGSDQCSFITHIGNVGAGESRSLTGHEFRIHALVYLDRA